MNKERKENRKKGNKNNRKNMSIFCIELVLITLNKLRVLMQL